MASRLSITRSVFLASGFAIMSAWNTYDALTVTHGTWRATTGAIFFAVGAIYFLRMLVIDLRVGHHRERT